MLTADPVRFEPFKMLGKEAAPSMNDGAVRLTEMTVFSFWMLWTSVITVSLLYNRVRRKMPPQVVE